MAKKKGQVFNRCTIDKTLPLDYLKVLQGGLKTLLPENYEKLKASILKHGFIYPIFVWENPEDAQIYIIDGTQRFHALTEMKKEGYSIPQLPVVFVEATDVKDAKEKLITAATQYGIFDELGTLEFMKDLNFSEVITFAALPEFNFSTIIEPDEGKTVEVAAHERTLNKQEKEELKNIYSDKIKAPIYKPTLEKAPDISELYDKSKTESLINDIKNNHNIPMEIKSFLIESAHRFTVFKYDLIAEYYAHSSKEVQKHMEDLALVIIDFDKAIENGFVRLTDDLEAMIDQQREDQ